MKLFKSLNNTRLVFLQHFIQTFQLILESSENHKKFPERFEEENIEILDHMNKRTDWEIYAFRNEEVEDLFKR